MRGGNKKIEPISNREKYWNSVKEKLVAEFLPTSYFITSTDRVLPLVCSRFDGLRTEGRHAEFSALSLCPTPNNE